MKNTPTELVDDLKVIRTIHSNKGRKFGNYNSIYLIITILVAVIVTFIGFSGAETISNLFIEKSKTESISDINYVQLIMNLMTLSILLITIFGLIFRFEHKMNKHYNAVNRLTEFISDVEFHYLTNETNTKFKDEDIKSYSEKYKSLINSLPSTKDKDYFIALKTIKKKKKIKKFINSEEYDNKNRLARFWHIKTL